MPDGRVCTLGAIGKVLYPSEPVSTVMSVVQWSVLCNKQSECEALLYKYLGLARGIFGIAKWNDRWWRTKGQVLRALRGAAKLHM